jgi:hypothetical protein
VNSCGSLCFVKGQRENGTRLFTLRPTPKKANHTGHREEQHAKSKAASAKGKASAVHSTRLTLCPYLFALSLFSSVSSVVDSPLVDSD